MRILPSAHIKQVQAAEQTGGHTTYHYTISPTEDFQAAIVDLLQDMYVPRILAAENPTWSMGRAKVPTEWKVKAGDFGEAITYALIAGIVGAEVPFVKLHTKPTSNATMQGPDTLAALVTWHSAALELLVEAKTTTSRPVTASTHRRGIENGLKRDRHLMSAWTFAVQEFQRYPEKRRVYAYQVARELADIHHRRLPCRLARHGVIVCGEDRVVGREFWNAWPASMPDCTLHVVEIDGIKDVIADVFERLNSRVLGDVIEAGLAHTLHRERAHALGLPGNAAPLGHEAAMAVVKLGAGLADSVAESACWYLSDHDGFGRVAALEGIQNSSSSLTDALLRLLLGDIQKARRSANRSESIALLAFVDAVERAWSEPDQSQRILEAGEQLVRETTGALADAARLVAAAIAYRLEAHPARFLPPAPGPMVRRLLNSFAHRGVRALWPGQVKAVAAGLLDPGTPAFAVEMPTSAGKTALIEMLCATAADARPGDLVVVLAPSRALVAQHTRDLRRSFGPAVSGLYGGYDVDVLDDDADISGAVVVMTPERFDLESRKPATDEQPALLDRTQLIVVDEAQLIGDKERGPKFELLLARAAECRTCRIVLLSSHLGNTNTLLEWLGAPATAQLSSDWRPAPLERGVYYEANNVGYVRWEHQRNDPVPLVEIDAGQIGRMPTLFDSPNDPVPSRKPANDQTGALCATLTRHGLTLVFVAQPGHVMPCARKVSEYLGGTGVVPPTRLTLIASTLAEVDGEAADLLLKGVGVHSRTLHSEVRKTVESAAKDGLLNAVVCTSTLAEGVDLPIATVLITGMQLDRATRLTPARVANLSGRAGRGGNLREGRVIIKTADIDRAMQAERLMAAQLPPTGSAMATAMTQLTNQAAAMLDVHANDLRWRVPDEILLAALEDVIFEDGAIRAAIESVLGRTLFATERGRKLDERLVEALVRRAKRIMTAVPDSAERAAYRRTGLPYTACVQLRSELAVLEESNVLCDLAAPEALHALIRVVVRVATAAGKLNNLEPEEVAAAAAQWIAGADENELRAEYPRWDRLSNAMDYTIVWFLSGAVEILCQMRNAVDAETRRMQHQALAVSRLRYGAPDLDVCRIILDGVPRRRALEMYREYLQLAPAEDDSQIVPSFSSRLSELPNLSSREREQLGLAPLPSDEEPF